MCNICACGFHIQRLHLVDCLCIASQTELGHVAVPTELPDRVCASIALLRLTVHIKLYVVRCEIFVNCDYDEWRLLGYKNPVCTSQETHYLSATEFSRLMLCKIWSFHSGDYEECRLQRYKNPVRTSQETHYFSATESSQLTLCKIWSFHGGDYEECRLLGYKNPVRTSQETHYFSAT
jgi:hypothetical protein